ncbi:MAG: DUF3276 family protein [Armatimonadota bacterium]|nr:DUF3276 family protein [Armatimonadota bacterium]
MAADVHNGEAGKAIFSEQVRAGGRTYFFDVRESKNRRRYLVITETRKTGTGRQRASILVFPDDVEAFGQALRKAEGRLQNA